MCKLIFHVLDLWTGDLSKNSGTLKLVHACMQGTHNVTERRVTMSHIQKAKREGRVSENLKEYVRLSWPCV